MKISQTTHIVLDHNSYLSFSTNEKLGTANLYLSGKSESFVIQFIPENQPILTDLLATLKQLEIKLQQIKLHSLQRQIDPIQNTNGNISNKMLTIVADTDTF